MTEQAAATGSFAPVRCAVTVPLSPERAFALFTEGYYSWWPHGHHLGKADLADVVLEPRTGGRYYERGVDGSECDWGRVLACDPPHRIVVSWQINANDETWLPDPDPAHASEFEVTFTGQPDGQTRPRSRRHMVAGQRHADPRCQRGGKRCVITMGRGDSQYAHQPVPG
jgi:uncharacterized protein YndB with AHSA1/START domain